MSHSPPPGAPLPLSPGLVNHVGLPTRDARRGAEFYSRVLGFHETRRPPFSFDGSWLWHPQVGAMLHLIHDDAHQANLHLPINTRTSHLAMQVSDYAGAVRGLQEHRVDYVERVLPDYGYRQLFFRDPDGNVLELGEWPSPYAMFPDDPHLNRKST